MPVMRAALRSVVARGQARGRDVVVVGASDEGESAVLDLLREVGWWEGGKRESKNICEIREVQNPEGEIGAYGI